MRLYKDCHEMYSEVKRDIHEMGTLVHPQTMQDKDVSRDERYRTLEMSPCAFDILDGSDRDAFLLSRGGNLAWAKAEIRERLLGLTGAAPVNPGDAWELRHDVWSEFVHNGRFAYTYSERFGLPLSGTDLVDGATEEEPGLTMIEAIGRELQMRPNTRQAVLPIFNALLDGPNLGGTARVPCSMHYQFLRRLDGLRCIYVMRSSDFMTHFPYDIWLALELQHRLAEMLASPVGRFTFFSGSLHIYAKDADQGTF